MGKASVKSFVVERQAPSINHHHHRRPRPRPRHRHRRRRHHHHHGRRRRVVVIVITKIITAAIWITASNPSIPGFSVCRQVPSPQTKLKHPPSDQHAQGHQ